jgi:hypothetical protein
VAEIQHMVGQGTGKPTSCREQNLNPNESSFRLRFVRKVFQTAPQSPEIPVKRSPIRRPHLPSCATMGICVAGARAMTGAE